MNREQYTRVTTIIEWLAQLWRIDPIYLDKRATVGTYVHEAIEAYIEDRFYPVDEEVERYIDSFKVWNEVIKPTIIEKEKRYYCDRLQITGQMDLIAEIGKKNKIIDFKTSKVSHLKTWRLQAAFYYYLAKENQVNVDREVLFIRLNKEGKKPKVEKINVTSDLLNIAFSVLNVYKYMK